MPHQKVRFGVNVDHIANIRQARHSLYPSPIQAAKICEKAGADLITVHLREDKRHIQEEDVITLRQVLETQLNLEMAVTSKMLEFAVKIKPDFCCLVPEKREELTTEGGLDIITHHDRVADACDVLKSAGIQVSLFVEPDKEILDAAKDCGAPIVELHTGTFCDTTTMEEQGKELRRIQEAVNYGTKIGLQVHAGHGLHYDNVETIAAIPGIRELNIGHSIVARAVFCGIQQAVSEMKKLIDSVQRPTISL